MGVECLFAFPSDPLLAGKSPLGSFYLGASYWPAHLNTVLGLDLIRQLLLADL